MLQLIVWEHTCKTLSMPAKVIKAKQEQRFQLICPKAHSIRFFAMPAKFAKGQTLQLICPGAHSIRFCPCQQMLDQTRLKSLESDRRSSLFVREHSQLDSVHASKGRKGLKGTNTLVYLSKNMLNQIIFYASKGHKDMKGTNALAYLSGSTPNQTLSMPAKVAKA